MLLRVHAISNQLFHEYNIQYVCLLYHSACSPGHCSFKILVVNLTFNKETCHYILHVCVHGKLFFVLFLLNYSYYIRCDMKY